MNSISSSLNQPEPAQETTRKATAHPTGLNQPPLDMASVDANPVITPGQRIPIPILGVPLDKVTTADAIARVEEMIASRRPHYMVTANVDFLVQAQEDIELHHILFDAHLVLCDGTPLVWASRWLGNSLPERVAGADLVPLLIDLAERKGYRLFFLGATPVSAQRAMEKMMQRHPRLAIAGHYSPPFSKLLEMDHEEIKRRIREARPDMLFVSFGCPKQEKWIAMHYQSLEVPVSVGVGATIDFLAGEVRRAPIWMQRSGLEWIFRLGQEPRRLFRRYVKDLWVFGWKFMAQSWLLRARRPSSAAAEGLKLSQRDDCQQLRLPQRLDLQMSVEQAPLLDQIMQDGRHCLLILDAVEFIDSTGVGMLIRLHKWLREQGRQLILVAPTAPVQRALHLMHLDSFFALASDVETARRRLSGQTSQSCTAAAAQSAPQHLRWQGEITAANVEQVWSGTCQHFGQMTGSSEWIIDLGEVRFLDSSGLGLMLRVQKMAQRAGSRLVYSHPPPCVRNVVQLARLEKILLEAPDQKG